MQEAFYSNGENGLAQYRNVAYNIIIGGYGNHDMSANSAPGGMPCIYLDDQTGSFNFYNNYLDSGSRATIFA